MNHKNEIQLRESNLADSENLNHFFSSIPIQGKIDLKLKRHIDFFSFYRRLNMDFVNYIFESQKKVKTENDLHPVQNEILGTASFLFQSRSYLNKMINVAFACDLRISPKRKAIINWSKFFLPQLKKIKSDKKIDHFLTSINLTEFQVINAFLRPRTAQTHLPVYELIQKFNLVSVHGFIPYVFKTHESINITAYSESDRIPLTEFIKKHIMTFDLVPADLLNNIDDYIQKSLIYSFQSFVIAKNKFGEIIGCTHPISSTLLQDYFPQKYDSQSNNLRQFLKFASILGWAKTLTRPFSSTNKEQTLNFSVLHFLFFDHPETLKSLLYYCYSHSTQNEFLIYMFQNDQYDFRPPIGTFSSKTPYGLFEIKEPEATHSTSTNKIKLTKNIFFDHLWF